MGAMASKGMMVLRPSIHIDLLGKLALILEYARQGYNEIVRLDSDRPAHKLGMLKMLMSFYKDIPTATKEMASELAINQWEFRGLLGSHSYIRLGENSYWMLSRHTKQINYRGATIGWPECFWIDLDMTYSSGYDFISIKFICQDQMPQVEIELKKNVDKKAHNVRAYSSRRARR